MAPVRDASQAEAVARIRANPTLHPLAFALVSERFPSLKWHSHADDPKSSQAFALSAFVPLLTFADKDTIIERLVTSALPLIPHEPSRTWNVVPEFSQCDLLGETGAGTPTNVDVLLVAEDAVVCVESKYLVDAAEGFGQCRQFVNGACRGFHGTGSDSKATDAPCRLEVKDGRRNPRRYWEVGRDHFCEEALAEQSPEGTCPLRETYQLMRNYLTAAELASVGGKPHYGAIGIAPAAMSVPIANGVEQFREVLRPENSMRVAVASYDDYVRILEDASPPANELGAFLSGLLPLPGA